MKRQYAICVSQKRLPNAHVALYWTVYYSAVTQWDTILFKVLFELLYASPTSKIDMKYLVSRILIRKQNKVAGTICYSVRISTK